MSEFNCMSKIKKAKFLSMDMIERMIRVEQTVASHFGKEIPYDKTEYFAGLTTIEKDDFKKYLKKRRKKRFLLGFFLIFVPILVISLQHIEITGNAIINNVGSDNYNLIEFLLFIFLAVAMLTYGLVYFIKRIKDQKFEKLERILYKSLNKR